ncbi:MAG: HEAT repeat domain-containing protein [Myxococcota bacterium]|nr:HEAT repeat domain-containing protein [Myxococcota bacterium]
MRVLSVLLAGLTLLVAPAAVADGRTQFLAERLKYPPQAPQVDDFRVRTNAALALGATNDDAAAAPLCAGLGDPSEVVRQAVAVALQRLARASSLECLRHRIAIEANASVKHEIERAIDVVTATFGRVAPTDGSTPYVPGAKYYVSVSPVVNKTSRPNSEVERIVRAAIASKLGQLGDYQLAPPGETSEAAKAIVGKRKMRGYHLGVSVEDFDYSAGSLRVRVKVAVFSYPGKDLRGEVPAGATLPAARPGDKGAEDQLMAVVAARATELFAQNFR